jgi:AAA ATPase domain
MLDRVLRGRASECARLDELLAAAREGRSGALVLRGEAGIGKTALIEYAATSGDESRVLRTEGVESEVELPFAALHQLCARLLGDVDALPGPQRDALQTAFGLSSGSRADPFFVGLAVLTLFSNVAESQPLICLVDDAQWLDHASAQALAFVARRLEAESVFMLFAERDSQQPSALIGLAELRLERLSYSDARELLATVNLGALDERVRDRIIAETRGNPLALIELPRAYSPNSLAGGFAVADESPLQRRIELGFRRRVERLPDETQRLLLLGAAEPLGDPALLWRAAAALGLATDAGGAGRVGRPGCDRQAHHVSTPAPAVGALRGRASRGPARRTRRAGGRDRSPTRIGARGIRRTQRLHSTRTSPPSSSTLRTVRGHGAVPPRRRPSSSGPPS